MLVVKRSRQVALSRARQLVATSVVSHPVASAQVAV
jgi:hypothetical protein